VPPCLCGESFFLKIGHRHANDPAWQRAATELALHGVDLRETLRRVVPEVKRLRVNTDITVLRAESDGTTLRFIFGLSNRIATISVARRAAALSKACAADPVSQMIEAGLTVEFIYLNPDGREIGRLVADRRSCAY
jgi:hypothetical protein